MLGDFPDDALAPRGLQNGASGFPYRGLHVGGREAIGDVTQKFDVLLGVARVTGRFALKAMALLHLPKGGQLVPTALEKIIGAESALNIIAKGSVFAGDETQFDPGALHFEDGVDIIKGDAFGLIPLRIHPDGAVGEDAVDVQDDGLDQPTLLSFLMIGISLS